MADAQAVCPAIMSICMPSIAREEHGKKPEKAGRHD
jgi:hypothetical protein